MKNLLLLGALSGAAVVALTDVPYLAARAAARVPRQPTYCPGRRMPRSIAAAAADFDRRKQMLIEHFFQQYEAHGFGNFAAEGDRRCFPRMAAALLKYEQILVRKKRGENVALPPSLVRLPSKIERWTAKIRKYGRAGTHVPGGGRADYDMAMAEMISFLYYFTNRKGPDGEYLLTTRSAFNILDRGLSHYMGEFDGSKMRYEIAGMKYPETENHVLMTYSSIYLTNQWIRDNPRRIAALRRGKYRSARFENRGTFVEDTLLQALGRIVHLGYFEQNGRSYQGLSLHAVLNLYSYADSRVVRNAAANALHYTATAFAFQSFEGKRYGPHRRNCEYVKRPGMFENDPVIFIMAALSGAYRWPDNCTASRRRNRRPSAWCQQACFYGSGTGQGPGKALWAALSKYQIPPPVHDFMLNKHTGYWARIHTRVTVNTYQGHRWPRYFDKRGKLASSGDVSASVELYFATPKFLNSAGGAFKRYPYGTSIGCPYRLKNYDFTARPHLLMPRGHFPNWDDAGRARDVMFMKGHTRWWFSNNRGTYKNFSYGYYVDAKKSDNHLKWPMNIPRGWERHRFGKEEYKSSAKSRASFRFYDLTRVRGYGYYVVLGKVSKSHRQQGYRAYARGFWEIVPASRFRRAADLVRTVLNSNPPQFYTDHKTGDSRLYRYKLATSGETVLLHHLIGIDNRCSVPIMKIWDARGRQLSLAEVAFDGCNQKVINRFPLLDVREVDARYRFTGRTFAFSRGNGRIVVHNPFVGQSLLVDSSNYKRPRSRVVPYRRRR